MAPGDLFYKIIVSDHVLFELKPDTKTAMTFIAIRRATGSLSIIYVLMTFQKGTCNSRSVQEKNGIPANTIDKELNKIQADFTKGVKSQTNFNVQWDALDLSGIADKKEQMQTIKKWGKMKVC